MAEVTLHPDQQQFPPGTTVKVKQYVPPRLPSSGEPAGTTLSEPTVSGTGTLTVTGLTEGLDYVAWAYTGGRDHYLQLGVFATLTGGKEGPPGKEGPAGPAGPEGKTSAVGIVKTPGEYGAKGNGKVIYDCITAAGGKKIKSATANFTVADVGKYVCICGAGSVLAGEEANSFVSRITAFNSASEVELDAEAVRSVANAMALYGTDDTAAIQQAINEAVKSAQETGQLYAEVAFSAPIYVVAGPLITSQNGNSQITLPCILSLAQFHENQAYEGISTSSVTWVQNEGKVFRLVKTYTKAEAESVKIKTSNATYWKEMPIPFGSLENGKVTLNLRGSTDACALPAWYQRRQQQAGAMIFSMGPWIAGGKAAHQAAYSPTNGRPSVIGGPTPEMGFQTLNYSNMYFKTTGLTMSAPQNTTLTGIDLNGVAACSIDTHSAFAFGIPGLGLTRAENPNIFLSGEKLLAGITENAFTEEGRHCVALGMPQIGNNATSTVGNVSVEAWSGGYEVGEHSNHITTRAVYCHDGIVIGPSTMAWEHAATFQHIILEANWLGIAFWQKTVSPKPWARIFCQLMDTEENLHFDIFDNGGLGIGGLIYWVGRTATEPEQPKVSTTGPSGNKRPHNLKLISGEYAPGLQSANPGVPATKTLFTNPYDRDCIVCVTGGTVTAIKTAPPGAAAGASGLTAGTVPVVAGGAIELEYTVAPTWSWVLL